jgi:hypothetical protein
LWVKLHINNCPSQLYGGSREGGHSELVGEYGCSIFSLRDL